MSAGSTGQHTLMEALATVVAVAGIAIAATTRDPYAVRMTLLVMSLGVPVRLWRW